MSPDHNDSQEEACKLFRIVPLEQQSYILSFFSECGKCLFQTFFQGKKKWLGDGKADSSLTPWWVNGTEMTHLSHGESMEQKQFTYPMVNQWNRNDSLIRRWVNGTETIHLPYGESMEHKWLTYPMVNQWNRNDSFILWNINGTKMTHLPPWWVNGTEMTHLPNGETMEQKWLTPWWDNGIKNDLPSVSQWYKKWLSYTLMRQWNKQKMTRLPHGETMEQERTFFTLYWDDGSGADCWLECCGWC